MLTALTGAAGAPAVPASKSEIGAPGMTVLMACL